MTITYVATSWIERRAALNEMCDELDWWGVWTNDSGLKFRFISEVNP